MSIILNIILFFTFFYPIVMTLIWIIGAIIFEFRFKKAQDNFVRPDTFMPFTIIVPVYNEERNIKTLLSRNLKINYPNVKFIVINDCSTDKTKRELDFIEENYNGSHELLFIHLDKNIGKASVLNYALDIVDTKYMIVIDSDTLLYPDALDVLNTEIFNEKLDNVAAYTGNISIDQSLDNYLLKIQRLEYRSIIGMIKRAQTVFFKNIMTVSGAIACFDVNIIKSVGKFETKNATEDIEITWRLSRNNYVSRYIPNMSVEITSPITTYDLLKQRERWSLGGFQTILQNKSILKEKGHMSNKSFIVETLFSSLWVFTFIFTTIYLSLKLLFSFPSPLYVTNIILPTLILIFTSSILLTLAYKFDKGCREYFDEFLTHMLYYPLVYWLVQPAGFLGGLRDYITIDKKETGMWRKKKIRNVRKLRVMAYVFDVTLFLALSFIWKMVVHDLVVFLPNVINTVYLGVLIYWIGVGILFNLYILNNKRGTFGEGCFGIEPFRNRNIIQNFFSILSIGFIINYYVNFGSTLSILNETNYYIALKSWEVSTQQGNGFEFIFLIILLIGSIEKYFGFSEKLFKNKMVLK